MQSLCGAAIDRALLQVMEMVWKNGTEIASSLFAASHAGGPEPISDRAIARYVDAAKSDPASFFPEPPPAKLEVLSSRRIRGGHVAQIAWRSGYRTFDPEYQADYDAFEENRTARAEWVWHDGPERPTIVCLHPWLAGDFRLQRRIFLRRYLFDVGFNVVLFVLPFHGERSPAASRIAGQLFPGRSAQRTNEGFGQVAWDVRSLIGALQQRGIGPVGVTGMSLGGYGAALLAACEPKLAFSVPIIPVVDLADLMWHHGRNAPDALMTESQGRSFTEMQEVYAIHCPLRHRPMLSRDRRMIIAGEGDRICYRGHVMRLWKHWDEPEIHWWPGSHVLHFGQRRSFRALVEFLGTATSVRQAA
jgi:hypothetical protein